MHRVSKLSASARLRAPWYHLQVTRQKMVRRLVEWIFFKSNYCSTEKTNDRANRFYFSAAVVAVVSELLEVEPNAVTCCRVRSLSKLITAGISSLY